jgi:hypothetical protein
MVYECIYKAPPNVVEKAAMEQTKGQGDGSTK